MGMRKEEMESLQFRANLPHKTQNPKSTTVWNYIVRNASKGVVLRWQRNRTGRPLSPPQIHQKNIWTLSKFHKTTSECQQRTSGTQKSSPLSLKGGRKNIKDKKRDKRLRDGAPLWEGSLKKERSFQTQGNTLTAKSVASLGTTEGNITGRKSK